MSFPSPLMLSIGTAAPVQIYWFCHDELPVAEHLLSIPERQRLHQLSPFLQKRFIQSRGMLRLLLAQYLKCDPRAVPIAYASHGKPIVVDAEMHFNLSHGGKYIVYGFYALGPLGIDVEQLCPRNTLGLARRYFCADEIRWLKAQDDPEQRINFYRAWVCKEAYTKSIGIRLLPGLQNLNTLPLLTHRVQQLSTPQADILEINAPIGYRAGLSIGRTNKANESG